MEMEKDSKGVWQTTWAREYVTAREPASNSVIFRVFQWYVCLTAASSRSRNSLNVVSGASALSSSMLT